jgi:hypothetical protein
MALHGVDSKLMQHLSEWRKFDPGDQASYPKVLAPIQVRYVDGKLIEVRSFGEILYSRDQVNAWRYIRVKSIS